MSKNTQCIHINDLDVKNIIFQKHNTTSIKNTNPPISFNKVGVLVKNSDGSIGDLVFSMDQMLSYGVQDNINQQTKISNGHTMSLVLTDTPATESQKNAIDKINQIVEICKDHIMSIKKEVKKVTLERYELKKLNPLFYRRNKETGEIDENKSPMWYVKFWEYKSRVESDGSIKEAKIMTNFYDIEQSDEYGNSKMINDPTTLIGKQMFVTPAIKLESIFIGSSIISLQFKLVEAEFKIKQTGNRRFLMSKAIVPTSTPKPVVYNFDDQEDELEIETN